MNLPNPLLIACAVLAALWGFAEVRLAGEKSDHANTHRLYADERAERALTVARGTGRVLKLERELTDATNRLNIEGENRRLATSFQARGLAALAAAHGGQLRDPHAGTCPGSGAAVAAAAGAGPGADGAAEAGGLLSGQLTQLLLRLFREADEINDAYAVCRPDSLNLRATRELSPAAP